MMGAPKTPPASPEDPRIIPYLEDNGVSWEDFSRRMTRDPEIKRIRSLVVTDLHEKGFSWQEMTKITSFGAGQLHGYTKAVRCEAARRNKAENGSRTGRLSKGVSKPWVTELLKKRWASGAFDFHRGRKCSETVRLRFLASWTTERRESHSKLKKSHWQNPSYREGLENFHRSKAERARRSRAQVDRMQEDPQKWTRGCGAWVEASKCEGRQRFWVRSRHEVAAVAVLEKDPDVLSFQYEPRFHDETGMTAIPDFIVRMKNGDEKLVEVKAAWVLRMPPDYRKQRGLARYRAIAQSIGLPFEVWTEEDVLHDELR